MKNMILIVCFLIYMLEGCYKPPSTDELEKDLQIVRHDIAALTSDNTTHSSYVKELKDFRLEILKNTEAMLQQKSTGINRIINITYNVDGKALPIPADVEQELAQIEEGLTLINHDIGKYQAESAKLIGGTIKILLDLNIATLQVTETLLKQKAIALKNKIPLYLPAACREFLTDRFRNEGSEEREKHEIKIADQLKRLDEQIREKQTESSKYVGGAIKILIEMNITNMELTKSLLNQKMICMKNNLPLYLPPTMDRAEESEKRVPMKGGPLDNL